MESEESQIGITVGVSRLQVTLTLNTSHTHFGNMPWSQLHVAAETGDVAKAKALLDGGNAPTRTHVLHACRFPPVCLWWRERECE
jgi:hypothetical protein